MVANAKAAVPTVGDNAVAMQLSTTAQNTAMALIELKNATGKVILLPDARKNIANITSYFYVICIYFYNFFTN